jgi:hypothetical protein
MGGSLVGGGFRDAVPTAPNTVMMQQSVMANHLILHAYIPINIQSTNNFKMRRKILRQLRRHLAETSRACASDFAQDDARSGGNVACGLRSKHALTLPSDLKYSA